jgi:type VI secretion system secreted protein Hcp
MRVPMKVAIPTAAALGAGAAVGAVAIGAIPDSGGVIHACYQKDVPGAGFQPGAVRIIDPSDTTSTNSEDYSCTPNETPIKWDEQGPQGPPGAGGASGKSGAAGSNGSVTILGNTNFGITATNKAQVFLKLDDIKGESQDDGHKGSIEIQSFSFGSEAPVVSSSAGAGAGKVTVSTFQIVSKLDKSTPMLERDLAVGKVIDSGEVDVVHVNAKNETQVASYKLQDLALKSITIKGERVTVLGAFKALKITLGSGQNAVSAKWNKVQNTGSWNLVQNTQG